MNPTVYRVLIGVQALTLLVGPFAAFAQVNTAPFTTVTDVKNFMCDIFGWLFYFLVVLSTIFVVIAAYRYLTAAGDPKAVQTANHMFLYAAVAVAVALLAKGIPSIMASILGTSAPGGC
ncbi:MAG: hypothetical protein Q7S28_01470 [bacterium]|nr:hypothetical protein [bacterium]